MDKENKENLPAHLRQEVDDAEREAVARMEIEYELRSNQQYKEFFATYPPDDVEEFIKSYARRKVTWVNWGKFYYEHNEDHQLRFYNLAQNCLWQIQQKKLFNLQCQWRAEKIKIPGVNTTMDFRYWEYNIKSCSFLPPITQWEFDLYMEYFQSDDSEVDPTETDYDFEWQDYIRFVEDYNRAKEKEDEDMIMPLWYRFYDNRMATDSLMTLEDIRGEKESKYLKLYYDHINKTIPEERADILAIKRGEDYLSAYNPALVEKFVRKYEDKQVVKYYLSYEKSHKPMEFADELAEMAFKELREISDVVSVKASSDWREAIIDAWEEYRRAQILKLLPLVYDDYLQKQNLGISYEVEDNTEIDSELNEWRNAILKGREMNGETPDYNF